MSSHTFRISTSFLPDFLPNPSLERGLREGMAVGNYELTSPIGEGGVGIVWRALQRRVDGEVEVAIKFCRVPVEQGGDLAEEIKLLEGLKGNAGTIHVLGGGVVEIEGHEFQWFAMPLLERQMLGVGEQGTRQRLQLFAKACRIVEQIHQRHIHRDLKPQHFFVNDLGEPVIIDFGMAATKRGGGFDASSFGGTVPYMSPELLRSRSELDVQQDVYSMGVILLQMLTGQLPYAVPLEASLDAAAEWWRAQPQVLAVRGLAGVPRGLRAVVRRAVHIDPKKRFLTVRDLREAVESYLGRWWRRFGWAAAAATAGLAVFALVSWLRAEHVGQQLMHLSTNLGGFINDAARVKQPIHVVYAEDERLRESLSASERTLDRLARENSRNEHILHADAVVADAMGYVLFLNDQWGAARPYFERAVRRGRQLTEGWPRDPLHHRNLVHALLRSSLCESRGDRVAAARTRLSEAQAAVDRAVEWCGRGWLQDSTDALNNLGNIYLEHDQVDAAFATFCLLVDLLPALADSGEQGANDWVLLSYLMIVSAEASTRTAEYDVAGAELRLREALARWDQIEHGENADVETVRAWFAERK